MGTVTIPCSWGELGKGSRDPVPWIMKGLSHSGKNSSHFVFQLNLMWNRAGDAPAEQQEPFRGRGAGFWKPPELLIHIASGIVYSTWSLGVIQIIHINFYTGVSPVDALSPKCLEPICFLEWGQNSQLLLTSLSSKCPWWVIIRCVWVSREEREGCGLIAFVWMGWVTAQSYIWHLDSFPSCILGVWISSGVRALLIDI